MAYWHITISSENRLPLFTSEAARRGAVCMLVRVSGKWLVIFCIVDDHVHVVLVCVPEALPAIRRALYHTLQSLTEVPLARPHAKRVENRRHLERLVKYFLTQSDHHGLSESLPLYSGSCYQDLVGARFIEGWQPLLFRALPRWREEDLHQIVDLVPAPLRSPRGDVVRAAGAAHVTFVASMSAGADPLLRGHGAKVVVARAVAARLGAAAGIAREEMSWALGVTPRALLRLEQRPVDPERLEAARRCIALVERACPELTAFRLLSPGRAAG